MIGALLQDLRYGLRILLKKPGFTAVAVLALALGIGANTAIFSVVNAVLLRPLPFKEPERLVMVWEHNRPRGRTTNVINPGNFLDWRDQNTVFEQMASFYDDQLNLTGDAAHPEEVPVQVVSTNLFSLLGTSPELGRAFVDEEGQKGRDTVAILSHGLWQRRFGGARDVIGKTIMLNGQSHTIVGVMPANFRFYVKQATLINKPVELWLPQVFTADMKGRRGRFMSAIARLKPGVTLERAQAEMNTIGSRLEQQYPEFNTGWGVNLVPLRMQMTGDMRAALFVLLGAVGFVLLIACANVANLLLARGASRRREMAIRTALGAGRARVIRQLLTESVLLAAVGGSLGLLLAVWGVDLLLTFAPKNLLGLEGIPLDYRVLSFTLGVSLLTGIIFGLAPALSSSRLNLTEALKEGTKGATGDGHSQRLRSLFVVSEIALALVLLVGSGLMIKSFMRLQTVDPGFRAENLLTFKLLLPETKYKEPQEQTAFFKQVIERTKTLPGVKEASAASYLPFTGLAAATGFTIEGQPEPAPGQRPGVDVRVIDPNYFRTMGIPLLQGRTFTEREGSEPSNVVIINETMAQQYWPGQDPLGKRVLIQMTDPLVPTEIVGVVGDAKHDGLDREVRAMAYWPHPQLPYTAMNIILRTESDPAALVAAVEREVQAIDKDQPIADVHTMEELLSESVSRTRFSTFLLSIFAGVALVLAAVGIYGVMAYSVTQRTHEIGIRMALGAQAKDVLGMVVGQGMMLALVGIAIGLAAAFALTRLISSLLYGVSATDPLTFISIALLLTGVAFLACFIPARKAAKVDPMEALRYE
jgi:putative ABC transport system permease protein